MLFEDTYNTIDKTSEGLYKEKGSKFIARAFPVKTEEDVKACLADLRKEFYDARHHCYAYQLGFDKSAFRMKKFSNCIRVLPILFIPEKSYKENNYNY